MVRCYLKINKQVKKNTLGYLKQEVMSCKAARVKQHNSGKEGKRKEEVEGKRRGWEGWEGWSRVQGASHSTQDGGRLVSVLHTWGTMFSAKGFFVFLWC